MAITLSLEGGFFRLTVPWQDGRSPERAVISFEDGNIGGKAFGVLYFRNELQNGAEGVVLFVGCDAKTLGKLVSLSFEAGMCKSRSHAPAP